LLHANACHVDRFQLVISLPPTSPADVDACRHVEQLIRRCCIPASIGFGRTLARRPPTEPAGPGQIPTLADLFAAATAVLTTSIQEGFGYVFFEPWLLNKAVLGRNLAWLTCDFQAEGLRLDHLYDRLLFPADWLSAEQRNQLRQSYRTRHDHLRRGLGLEPLDEASFRYAYDQAKLICPTGHRRTHLDWADLTLELQLFLLEQVARGTRPLDRLLFIRGATRPLSDWFSLPRRDIIACNRKVVIERYGLASGAGRFARLLEQGRRLCRDRAAPVTSVLDNRPVLEKTLALENLHLLA